MAPMRTWRFWIGLAILFAANIVISNLLLSAAQPPTVTISYNAFLDQVNAGNVRNITSTGESITGSTQKNVAGLPMILINPIPGQEVRNSDFLLEEGAAVRCNYGTTIGYKIATLLDAPDRVARMAANARRIGRPDAAEVIVNTALAETPQLVWISREARRLIRNGVQQGPSVLGRTAGGDVRTVVDASTDASVALVTGADLRRIASRLPPAVRLEPELRVTPDLVAHLKRRRVAADAVAMLDNALGTADEVVLQVQREAADVLIGR